jgi:spore coat protein SA
MKIAFVCSEYHPVPPVEGGAVETWIEEVSQRLTSHEVVVCSIFRRVHKKLHKRGHVRYLFYKKGWIAKILLCTYKLPFKNEGSCLYWLPYSFWFAWRLRRYRPDIIHIHNRPQFVAIFRKLHPKAKIILHIHQLSAMEEKGLWGPEFIKSIDLFLGASRFLAEKMRDVFAIAPNKVSFLYDGVDTGRFLPYWQKEGLRQTMRSELKAGTDKIVVLYVGRLVENKGADILMGAFRGLMLKNDYSNAMLVFCGAKGYSSTGVTSYMEALFDLSKPLKDSVVFTGYVPHNEIHKYYAAADLLVIPSRVEEGFGMIAIEGMASGLPVITSGRGALTEIVRHKEDGYNLSELSVESLRDTLVTIFKNFTSFAALGRTGRRRAEEQFSWEKAAEDTEKIYREVLQDVQG